MDAHDDRDDTALHTAARTGNFDIVMVSESQVVLKPGKTRKCIGVRISRRTSETDRQTEMFLFGVSYKESTLTTISK